MAIVPFESYDKPWYLAMLMTFSVIQSFLTSAPIFGFSSILVVFKKMQFYRQLCPSNFTSINQTEDTSFSINLITCKKQDNALNLMFVIGIVFHCGVKFFVGRIVDKIGARVCQYIGCVFIIIFSACLGFSSQGREYLVIISFIILSFGSSFLMLTCYQIVNIMFKKNKSFFLCILSGAVDSSTAVFIIFLELFDNGFSLKTISFAFGIITVSFVSLTTVFLYPSLEETNKVIDDEVKSLFKKAETPEEKDPARFSYDLSASYHGGATSTFNVYKGSIQRKLLVMSAEERHNNFNLSLSRSMGFSYDALEFDDSPEKTHLNKRSPATKDTFAGCELDDHGASAPNELIPSATEEKAHLINKSKDLFNSVTDDSLTQHIFSKLNFLMIFCFSLTQIRILYFIGNLDKYFDNITDIETGTKYIKYFGVTQFLGILVGPIAGLLFIRKPNDNVKTEEDLKIERLRSLILPGLVFIANIMLLTALQLCEQISLSIPMFLLYLSSNGLMWCYSTTFYGLLFPPQYFCSMYGFLMVFSGAASFLQSPLLYLEQRVFHGNQLWTNLTFMVLLTSTLILPLYLWCLAKHLEKQKETKKINKPTKAWQLLQLCNDF